MANYRMMEHVSQVYLDIYIAVVIVGDHITMYSHRFFITF